MSVRQFRVVITSPTGVELEATPRLDIGSLGSLSMVPESDLGILTHSDMTLDLDNADGEVEKFFTGADVDDIYEILLERKRDDASQWDRLFGGVLDLPYSLSYDDSAKTAHLIAYSYSKQMERTPADTIKRTLASKTASITINTSQLVFFGTEASDLEIGDIVRMNDGTNREEFTVVRIIDTANVITSAAATRTFTSEFAEVITPFYHDLGPVALLQLLADETSPALTFNNQNVGSALADFPIATPLSQAGLNIGGVPQSVITSGDTAIATFESTWGTKRKVLSAPDGAWTDGDTDNTAQLDWTPYTDTDPGATYLESTGTGADTGTFAADYANSHVWFLSLVGPAPYAVHLFKDGVDQGAVSPTSDGFHLTTGTGWFSMDYDYDHDGLLISYNDNLGTRAIKYYVVFGPSLITESSTYSGRIRTIRYDTGIAMILVDDTSGAIEFWDMDVVAMRRSIEWDPDDFILTHTIRTWGDAGTVDGIASKRWMTFLFERNSETWVAVFDVRGTYTKWKFVAEYRISSVLSDSINSGGGGLRQKRRRAYQTILNPDSDAAVAIVYAAGQWAVLSTSYDGVIRYADFEDSSCAKAARDIAVIMDSIVHFDQFKVMTVLNRKVLGTGQVVADLGPPLTMIRRPISEYYRSSVSVEGSDSDGNSIFELQGDSGDSARRVEIDSDLITTPGMALACALTTLQFVTQIREQRDVTITDDGTPLNVFDHVTMDGKEWLIYKIDTDLEQQTHDIVLLEILE